MALVSETVSVGGFVFIFSSCCFGLFERGQGSLLDFILFIFEFLVFYTMLYSFILYSLKSLK